MRAPSIEHGRLAAFVGSWHTEGEVLGDVLPASPFYGADEYEWVPGGYFLLHRWDAQMPHGRNEGVEIIGYDRAAEMYWVRSFDSDGNVTELRGEVSGDAWTFTGELIRFVGAFADEGNVLTGQWEQRSVPDGPWQSWMQVTLCRNA